MDERNMIIGLAIVLVLAGAYFVFAQDMMCTSDENCGPCEFCGDGTCYPLCESCEACVNDVCVDNCPDCQYCAEGECYTNLCSDNSDCDSGCFCNDGTCTPIPVDPCADVICGSCEYCSGGSCYSTCSGCQSCIGGECTDDDSNCGECGTCTNTKCVQNSSNCANCEVCGDGLSCEPCDCSNVACDPGCVCDDGSCFEGNCVESTDCTGTCERCVGYDCITDCEVNEDCPDSCTCSDSQCVTIPIPPSPDGCKPVYMTAAIEVGCEENIVTVSNNDNNPVEVRILKLGDTIIGTTDSSGVYSFVDTSGMDIEVKLVGFNKGGKCYKTASKVSATLKTAAECGPAPVCGDAKIEGSEQCEADTDCQANYTCTNCACVANVPIPPEPECKDSSGCGASQACSGGSCIDVTGVCGYVDNHAWVNYECCVDADCLTNFGSDYYCSQNLCVPKDYNLTGESGFVGDTGAVQAFLDGSQFANAGLRVTKPDGTYEILTTDTSGQISFTFAQAGLYTFDLFVNGTIKETLKLTAIPKTPVDDSRPDFFDVLAQQSWILLIALIIILALIYWFYIAPKGKGKKKK